MKRSSPILWTIPTTLLLLGAATVTGLASSLAYAQENAAPGNQSLSGSISSSVKRGFSKIGNTFSPKPSHAPPAEDESVSLKSKSKPGPNLYVAIARLYVQSDRLGDAEQQYQMALNEKRDFLPAILGLAEVKEKMGQPEEAIRQYRKAIEIAPNESSVYNNLGLCFARQGRLDEAASTMTRAVQMAPKNPLYRNNMAMILIDQGKAREAYGHLRQVYPESVAYYNLGYLLNKKGQTQAAMQHFSLALRADPSMVAARNWVEHLQRGTTQARLPNHPTADGLRITDGRRVPDRPRNPTFSEVPQNPPEETPEAMPPASTEEPELRLPEAPMPRRLPPTTSRVSESDGPSLPGITYNGQVRRPVQAAPLPPPATNSAVRHLPRVN